MNWLTEIYRDMCHTCNGNVAPVDLDSSCEIGLISLYKEVTVTIKHDDSDNYGYNIVSIKENS